MDDRERTDELRVLGTAGIHSVPMEVAGVASALGPEAQGVAVESTRPLVTSEDCKKRYSTHLHVVLHCRLKPQTGSDVVLHCQFYPKPNHFLIFKLITSSEDTSLSVLTNPAVMRPAVMCKSGVV